MAKTPKDYRPAFFAPIPNRAIVDTRLTPTAFRLLMLYAYHDRLSLTELTGGGCYVSNKTLCERLECDYTTLIKLRSNLRDWGYITLRPRPKGKRLEVVLVIPDHLADPKTWPFDPSYIGYKALETWGVAAEKVGEVAKVWNAKAGELANFVSDNVGEVANVAAEKVGEQISETPENLPKTRQQYIPRRGETYSSEEGEYNSTKWRDFGIANGRDCDEARLGSESLRALMSPKFDNLDYAAQVAQIDRAFGSLDRNSDRIVRKEFDEMTTLLWAIHDNFADHDFGQQAWRLYEEMKG